MDTGKGRFAQFDAETVDEYNEKLDLLQKKHTSHGGVFRVGEEIEIRGSRFRIKSIKPTELRLKLLKKEKK